MIWNLDVLFAGKRIWVFLLIMSGVAPTFIVTAENDDLAIAEPVHQDIEALCALGYSIEHLQCAGLGHVDGALIPWIQWSWIQGQLEGRALNNMCVVQEPIVCAED